MFYRAIMKYWNSISNELWNDVLVILQQIAVCNSACAWFPKSDSGIEIKLLAFEIAALHLQCKKIKYISRNFWRCPSHLTHCGKANTKQNSNAFCHPHQFSQSRNMWVRMRRSILSCIYNAMNMAWACCCCCSLQIHSQWQVWLLSSWESQVVEWITSWQAVDLKFHLYLMQKLGQFCIWWSIVWRPSAIRSVMFPFEGISSVVPETI